MNSVTKQAIGFGISMALIFGVASRDPGLAVLFGVVLGVGFFAYRKRRQSD
jgi:hypothetical protein